MVDVAPVLFGLMEATSKANAPGGVGTIRRSLCCALSKATTAQIDVTTPNAFIRACDLASGFDLLVRCLMPPEHRCSAKVSAPQGLP
jgi:hypothetical protein